MGSAHSQKNWHASGNSLAICGKHDLYSRTASLSACANLCLSQMDTASQQQLMVRVCQHSAPNTKEHKKRIPRMSRTWWTLVKWILKLRSPALVLSVLVCDYCEIGVKTVYMHYINERWYVAPSRQSRADLLFFLVGCSLLLNYVHLT